MGAMARRPSSGALPSEGSYEGEAGREQPPPTRQPRVWTTPPRRSCPPDQAIETRPGVARTPGAARTTEVGRRVRKWARNQCLLAGTYHGAPGRPRRPCRCLVGSTERADRRSVPLGAQGRERDERTTCRQLLPGAEGQNCVLPQLARWMDVPLLRRSNSAIAPQYRRRRPTDVSCRHGMPTALDLSSATRAVFRFLCQLEGR
jgi:hypothetical protein